ncbi:MAG: energy transducer TonB [Syntrophales bacterium]
MKKGAVDMNEQRMGVITSLAIHTGFLIAFLMMPFSTVIPYTKTIYISFMQQEKSGSNLEKGGEAILKPQAKELQHTSVTELATSEHPQDEVLINEKPVVASVKNMEITGNRETNNRSSVKTESTNLARAENLGMPEARFGDTGAPAFIHSELPVYPLLARRLGKEGRVVLELLIDKSGILQYIKVVEPSGFGFTEAAVEAVRKSTFSPALKNGEGIAARAILSVRFNLK